MATHDYVISNQSFPSTRTDLNNVLQAIVTNNSNATAPSTTFASMLWYDTANDKFFVRNSDNDAWIELFKLDETGDHLEKIGDTITLDGTGQVGIGITPTAQLHISGDDVSNQVIIENTSDDANHAPDLLLKRNSASPADDDEVGQIVFQGRNDNSQFPTLATMRVIYKDVTDTTEDAALVYELMTGGTKSEVMRIEGGKLGIGTTFGENIASSVNKFAVRSDTGGTHYNFMSIWEHENTTSGIEQRWGWALGDDGGGESSFGIAGYIGIRKADAWNVDSTRSTAMTFATTNANALTEHMRIRPDGNVGIGTAGGSTVRLFVIDTHASNYTQYVQNQSGSYAGSVQVLQSQRAATTAYSFLQAYASTDLEFHFRGDGNAFADGSFSGGGADYAEMFEWADGNSDNEDRRGFSVVLTDGNKIRKATSDDAATDIIGIVSANPTVLGDSAWNMWDEKYNKDDFGAYILETYTVTEWTEPAVTNDDGEVTQEAVEHSYETDKIPSDLTVPSDAIVSSVDADGNTLERRQLNSSYDDTQTYTPREERQEWDAVGMMGKLRMRSGQPTGDRWIKMRDITSDIEEWLVR